MLGKHALPAALLGAITLRLLFPPHARAQPSSPFAPASPEASAIAQLFLITLGIAGVIFLLVQGLLLYMVARFRARPGAGEPRPVFGYRPLEIGWTVGPALLLAGVFGLMLPLMGSDPGAADRVPSPPAEALAVTVIGHQWWWELRYPTLDVVTANELHIPVGEPVRVRLESADVIHSFWLPRLGGKLDVIPGRTNQLWLYTEAPGVYLGPCAEFCGLQHAWMLLRVIAQPRADFLAWAAQQRQPAAPPSGAAQRGQQLFLEQTCVNCHTLRGTPAQGTVGPDLTHVGSRQTLGAGVLENTPANMYRWLQDPQAVKPGSLMPTFYLSDADTAALAAYLAGLK
ncbi:MAG TPA: cytochrome c oxidase subunit II [Chloroflexota bacterium]|nr:cytochrome c oxidase subunit II [Chloroflexota bacterium]